MSLLAGGVRLMARPRPATDGAGLLWVALRHLMEVSGGSLGCAGGRSAVPGVFGCAGVARLGWGRPAVPGVARLCRGPSARLCWGSPGCSE